MNDQPLVSAIIIFFNAEEFIHEAIASVFSQTYDNWELLLVDDGSTDNTTNIALDYAQKYPTKVRYLDHENHQNRGASSTRNLGISHAKGQYIAFLDADDIWLPNKLTEQIAILETHPEVAMVYGKTQWWYSWNNNPEQNKPDYFLDLGVKANSIIKPPQLLPILWQHQYQAPTTCNAIMRRDVFDKVGGFEENWRGLAEDRVFFTKLELHEPVYVADKFWAKYRKHPNSTCAMASQSKKQSLGYHTYYKWVKKYLISQGIKDKNIWKEFNQAKFLYDYPWLHSLFKQGFADEAIALSKRILPKPLRHWLWLSIGQKLYHHTSRSQKLEVRSQK